MQYDVSAFRDFYYRSTLGRSVQRRIRAAIDEIWGDMRGTELVGFGFAAPYLRPFFSRFENIVNLMPEHQGVMVWPSPEKNISVLCEETLWPLAANTVDCAIIAHVLENSRAQSEILYELYRTLSPIGRAIIILPNRTSVWARNETTPFGSGRPYSLSQAERLLRDHDLIPSQHRGALYAPPTNSRIGRRTEKLWEASLGYRKVVALGGALVIEVQKQMPPRMIRRRVREPIFAIPDLAPASARLGGTRCSPRS